MKFPFSSSNSYLFLYTAGTGGEFFVSAASQCIPEVNSIPRQFVNGHWSVVCKAAYSEVALQDRDFYTRHYKGETTKPIDFYKDHYQKPIKEYWPSDMNVVCFELTKNYEYWAEITWKKLNTYITINKDKFIADHIETLKYDYKNIQTYLDMFKKCHIINIDNMHTATVGDQLLEIFPSLDVESFNRKQKYWIDKNNG